jgi:uncharacterized protein YbaR (Trm112 family)
VADEQFGTPEPDAPSVDPKVLEFLVCPLTKTTLIYDRARQELISRAAGLAYPIRNGVPLMIEETARPLTSEDLRGIEKR